MVRVWKDDSTVKSIYSLPENLNSVFRTHIGWLTTIHNSNSWGSEAHPNPYIYIQYFVFNHKILWTFLQVLHSLTEDKIRGIQETSMKSPGPWTMKTVSLSSIVLLAFFLGIHLGAAART